MEPKNSFGENLGKAGIIGINIVQLLQVLSFVKYAPKSGSWKSSVNDIFDFGKDLSLRFDNETYLVLYSASVLISVLTIVLYVVFSNHIHRINKSGKGLAYLIYFIEYIIFGLGFVPMVSKFVETQICNDSLKIDVYTSVKCFKTEQLVMLELGFFCIGLVFLISTAVLPALKYERDSVEKLWHNESYFEGYYYLVLIGVVSLLGYIELPWVGILVCGVALIYGLINECYESLIIASSRCGVLAALVWAFGSAQQLKSSSDSGSFMLYFTFAAYLIGFGLRVLKSFIFKRPKFYIPPPPRKE